MKTSEEEAEKVLDKLFLDYEIKPTDPITSLGIYHWLSNLITAFVDEAVLQSTVDLDRKINEGFAKARAAALEEAAKEMEVHGLPGCADIIRALKGK